MLSRRQAMAQENSSGLVPNDSMVSGSDLIKKNLLRNVHSISIKFTSEPNTTTIPTILTVAPSIGTSFSITTRTTLPVKIMPGSLNENALMLLHQLTLLTPQERSQTILQLLYLELMDYSITTS